MASRELVVSASEMMALTPAVAAAAIAAAQTEAATYKDELDRLRTAVEQVLSGATDLLGTSTGAQLLARIHKQLSPAHTPAPAPAPAPSPIPLTGTTMYSGRGAPRRSDYRKPNDELLKPCAPTSPRGAELYRLPDGSVRSLSSLSSTAGAANAV